MAKKGSEMLEILKGIELAAGNGKKKAKLTMWTEKEVGDIVSYGLPGIDAASACGGHPKGKIIEIYGPESSGKSFAALKMIAAYQAAGMNAALVDVEHSFWGPWAAQHGVDISKLIYGQDFISGEQAMKYAQLCCESKSFGLVVIDSIAALMPQSEIDSDMDDKARVGSHAAMMSRCLKKLQDVASKTDTTILCINQIRMKIGGYGNPEDTPGGKALKFYAAQRISLRRMGIEIGKVDGVNKPIGIRTKVKFEKNRIGQPFGEDEFVIFFVPGFNTPVVQLVNLAIRLKVVPPRKASDDDDDKKTYHWKVDGELEDTKCSSAADLAEWFEANDSVIELLDLVVAKAAKANESGKEVVVPDEVLAIRTAPPTVKSEGEVVEDEDQQDEDKT